MPVGRIDFERKPEREYLVNQYRVHKFDDKHVLITTDNGAWVLLNSKEYGLFRTHKIEEDLNLYAILKENGIIVTKENIDQVVEDYRKRYRFLFQGPDLHIMVPTFRCNLRCVYCHSFSKPLDANAKEWDMDKETAKAVVDFMFKTTARDFGIEFQGGDCSFNFDVVKFAIDYAKSLANKQKRKVSFSVVTNLTKADDDFIKFLKDNIPIGLCTSLDGPKEVHDKNRRYLGGKGSYEDVVYWIKRIREEMKGYDFKFHALTTVTKHSLGYGKEIVDEFRNLGFHFFWPRFMNNLGFAERTWGKIGYTAEEYLRFWNDILEYVLKINRSGEEFREVWAFLVSSVILGKEGANMVDFRSPCGAGIGQLLYNNKGDIFTCDEAKVLDMFKLGNVKTSKYEDVFKSPTTTSMIDISSKFCSLCDACPWFAYCALCPVNIYTSQGSIVPKLAEDMRCRIFKGMIKTIFEKIIFSERDRDILEKWVKI
jgi:His-Xaa-Ser system radical SAM maturase HxsB